MLKTQQEISNTISGLYSGFVESSNGEDKTAFLELRIDIDGNRPLKVLSGDLFLGANHDHYLSSFIFDHIAKPDQEKELFYESKTGKSSISSNQFTQISVTFDKDSAPLWTVKTELLDAKGVKSVFSLKKVSNFFRTVVLENDYEEGVIPCLSYDTALLPCPVSRGMLTIPDIFAEAGIELIRTERAANVVKLPGGESDHAWSDSELHAAMEANFSAWINEPQWKVWLFSAKEYGGDTQTRGIMFDHRGKPRQGCATFFKCPPDESVLKRYHFFIYIHELSHCFNLLHPWDRGGVGEPGGQSEYSVLSWLNYPQYYSSKKTPSESAETNEDNFFKEFNFSFIDSEIMHLRHGFRNNVIFGGSAFGSGTGASPAFKESVGWFYSEIKDRSTLNLELKPIKSIFAFGEPVVVEIKLSCSEKSAKVHNCLHPKTGLVNLAISDPEGNIRTYKPLLKTFVDPIPLIIDESTHLYDSAFIGYGQDGFYFKHPGVYKLRAIYHALNSSTIFSNQLQVQVEPALTEEDKKVANSLLGDQQGFLLYLKGSDSDLLKPGTDELNNLINDYPLHPLTTYARFIEGYNAGRRFKTIDAKGQILSREPKIDAAQRLLSSVLESSFNEGGGLDNISLEQAMIYLAKLQRSYGLKDKAEATLDGLIHVFRKRKVNSSIIESFLEEKERFLAST